jgi:hypothetical protein
VLGVAGAQVDQFNRDATNFVWSAYDPDGGHRRGHRRANTVQLKCLQRGGRHSGADPDHVGGD